MLDCVPYLLGVVMTKLILALALALAPLPAKAQIGWGKDFATISCGEVVKAEQPSNEFPSPTEIAILYWAQGWMTGMNARVPPPYKDLQGVSPQTQIKTLLGYCGVHPLDDFVSAALYLYSQLPVKNTR
jgi:hypothetical protein